MSRKSSRKKATQADPPLHRRLPAAAVALWPDRSRPGWEWALEEAGRFLSEKAGAPVLDPGIVPVLPVPGDPAVFDAALAWAEEIVHRLAADSGSELVDLPLRLLIVPTVVTRSDSGIERLPDPLLDDFLEVPPELRGPGVFMTSHASRVLELPRQFIRGGSYRGTSGTTVPLVMAGGARSDLPPWRNPELLGRRLGETRRPGVESELDELCEAAAARVVGTLGVGKTRTIWAHLRRRGERFVWLRARPPRRPRPSLGDQIVQHLLSPAPHQREDPTHPGGIAAGQREKVRRRLSAWQAQGRMRDAETVAQLTLLLLESLEQRGRSPVRLVIDDLESIGEEDRDFLAALLRMPSLGSLYRVLLVGRRKGRERSLAQLPTLRLEGPLEAEMTELALAMTEGLSIPDAVRNRFLAACAENPFAFEEGLFGLLHERAFRRVYGSFFFGGDEATEYRPSLRLVRHLEAEGERLDVAAPLLLLSLSGRAVPAEDLTSACAAFDVKPGAAWPQLAVAAGLAVERESPWGAGLELSLPAFGYALSFTLPGEESSRVRHELGMLLALRSAESEASWYAYKLLAGSEEAIEPLLAALGGSSGLPPEELATTVANELELHRLRGGNEKVELELLWRLLPLARRMGQLQRFREELPRALELAAGEPKRLLAIAGIKAELEHEGGDSRQAETTIRAALKAATGTDITRQALLLIQLGKILLRQSRTTEARRILENLLAALEESDAPALRASCLFFLGNIALQEGRVEEALDSHKAALDERLAHGLKRPAGSSYSALGTVSVALGDYLQALDHYDNARKLLEEHGPDAEISFALLGIGRALGRLGDFPGASKPIREALKLRQGKDDQAGEAIARLAVARNYLDLGRPEEALEAARKAHFQLTLLSLDDAIAEAEHLLGRIAFVQRKYDRARRHFAAALQIHRKLGDDLEVGFDHSWLLETAVALEEAAEVSRHAADLKGVLEKVPHIELAEILNYRLFHGLEWLSRNGQKVGDPTPYLDRAYQQLLGKARHLEPDQRNRFLFQIAINQEIVQMATRLGLAGRAAPGA